MKLEIADEDAFIAGRSPQKARELIAAAKEAGIDPARIRTTSSGYIVPKELGGEGGDEKRVEVGFNLPTERVADGIDDEQVQATVGSALLKDIQPVADAGAVEGAILNSHQKTDAKTEGAAKGNGSSTVGDSAHHTEEAFTPQDAGEHADGTPVDLVGESTELSSPNAETVQSTEQFDPTKHTVAEVQEYLATADDAEKTRVLEAEKASEKPRKTLTGEGE